MGRSHSEKLTAWIIAHQSIILLLIIVISAVCFVQVRLLEISGDMGAYVDGSDPDLKTFISKSDRFGNYETFIFVVRADDVLAPNVRQIIQRMGDQLNQNIHVERVVSLTNLPIEALGETHERDELLRDPYLGEYLLSADGMQAQLLVFVDISEIGLRDRLELAGDLRSLAESSATASVAIGVTGPSVVAIDAMDLSRQDFTRVIWLLPLLLGGVVLIVFQRHLVVLAPVLIVSLAILWTLAAFVAAGNKLSLVTSLMPVIIAVITFADVIHILHKYYCEASKSQDVREVVLKTMGLMNGACFMTSITTAVGFLAILLVTPISIVRQLTIWTAMGVLIAYVLTINLMPIFLSHIALPDSAAQARYSKLPIYALARRLHRHAMRPQRFMPFILLLLAALFAWGSTQLGVRTNMSRFLPHDVASIQALELLPQGMDGADSLEVIFELHDSSYADAGQLLALQQLEFRISAQFDEVLSVRSLTGAIESLYARDGNSGFPDDANVVDEYLLLLELAADEDWLRSFIAADYESARISLQIKHQDSRSTLTLIREIDDWLQANVPAGWSVQSTGMLKLLVLNVQSLLDSQLMSFLLAVFAITLVLYIFLRDLVLSAISLIANFLPVILTMGVIPLLAATGVLAADSASLNVSTVMVPSLAMAIAVDDTIHFLVYFRQSRANGASLEQAIEAALHGAGFAMMVTTVAMVLGLSVLLFSRISANQEFAAMMCIALLAALLSDLVLLPHLIKRWKR